jgi:hypothetical protein
MKPKFETVDGYRYYNFALFHTKGYGHVFDMLRYDRAFLCRKADVDDMKEAATDYTRRGANKPRSILICRYDWRGKTRPSFTSARLLKNQEYEMIDDVSALYELNSDFLEPRPSKPLKIQAELEVTGQLPWVLDVMYLNRAVPSTETDARRMEGAFSKVFGEQEITVKLVNFNSVESDWTMP